MFYETIKRIIDIVVATVIIIIFSPVFIALPILIKFDSSGPVFADIPMRVGKNKKLFKLLKYRSMIANAHQLLKEDPRFRALYEKYKNNSYKVGINEDPRITKIGKFIRRFSLDELPQVFNVLRGEMSVVGPRAYYPDELENQQKAYPESKKYIHSIMQAKPGMTGYWQVHGRSEINFDKRVKMDASYVGRKSISEDILIILKTPWAMFSGKGAL